MFAKHYDINTTELFCFQIFCFENFLTNVIDDTPHLSTIEEEAEENLKTGMPESLTVHEDVPDDYASSILLRNKRSVGEYNRGDVSLSATNYRTIPYIYPTATCVIKNFPKYMNWIGAKKFEIKNYKNIFDCFTIKAYATSMRYITDIEHTIPVTTLAINCVDSPTSPKGSVRIDNKIMFENENSPLAIKRLLIVQYERKSNLHYVLKINTRTYRLETSNEPIQAISFHKINDSIPIIVKLT